MASSASKSYHSNGAELGDGRPVDIVNGDRSNRNSGELENNLGSTSPVMAFRATGDAALVVGIDSAGDLEAGGASLLLGGCVAIVATAARAYAHSLSDLEHCPQRGFLSSHFTLLFRHVKLCRLAKAFVR